MSEDYENMTVAQLKELLKEADLPVSGKKADLIARLAETSAAEEVETSDSNDEDWDDDGDWDEEAVEGHVAKQKPVLDDDTKAALALRSEQKKKTPSFRRTEWFRYKRLSRSGWRAPHGMDSKQRRNYKYRSALVRVGHGKVAALEASIHLDSEKSWCKTPQIWKSLTLKPKQHASDAALVVESENKFIHEPMNLVFVFLTEGGIFDANYKSKAPCC